MFTVSVLSLVLNKFLDVQVNIVFLIDFNFVSHLMSEILFLFGRFLYLPSFSVLVAVLWYHMSVIPRTRNESSPY